MDTLRLAVRVVAVSGFTFASYLFLLASAALLHAVRGDSRAWRARCTSAWARTIAPWIGMRLEVEGPAPRPPFFLVSNHLSYVDILVLATQLRCAFVAKADIASWPVFGALCRATGTLFIERANRRDIPRVVRQIEEVLAEGVGVVIFPEATSSRGEHVLPFRPSLLEVAASRGLAVSYAAITYRTPEDLPPAHEVVCWWGDMTFPSHLLALLRLREFRARVVFGQECIRADDRKVLAEMLHRAVSERFRPVVDPEMRHSLSP